MYRCTNRACGKLWEQAGGCPACGATFLVPQALEIRKAPAGHRRRQRSRLRSFAELATDSQVQRYCWGYEPLRLPIDAGVSLEGPRGGGKSTVATLVALALGHQNVPVLYVATEKSFGETLPSRIRQCAEHLGIVPSSFVQVSDAQAPHELEDDLATFRRGVVMIDSANELRPHFDDVANIRARGLGVLLVQHWTQAKQLRGGLGVRFGVDVCLEVDAMEISALYSPLGTWGVLDTPTFDEALQGSGVLPFPAPEEA